MVTNNLGTSRATPVTALAVGGPEPVVVTSISPPTGSLGTQVTINGIGFQGAGDVIVSFGSKAADHTVMSDTEIQATAPLVVGGGTVDITVTVGVATSPKSPACEFTYDG